MIQNDTTYGTFQTTEGIPSSDIRVEMKQQASLVEKTGQRKLCAQDNQLPELDREAKSNKRWGIVCVISGALGMLAGVVVPGILMKPGEGNYQPDMYLITRGAFLLFWGGMSIGRSVGHSHTVKHLKKD